MNSDLSSVFRLQQRTCCSAVMTHIRTTLNTRYLLQCHLPALHLSAPSFILSLKREKVARVTAGAALKVESQLQVVDQRLFKDTKLFSSNHLDDDNTKVVMETVDKIFKVTKKDELKDDRS